jgi:hypothetical protein
MTRRDQFFDRQNDHTKEVVTFQDTGEVKFSKEGKLSEKNLAHVARTLYRSCGVEEGLWQPMSRTRGTGWSMPIARSARQ